MNRLFKVAALLCALVVGFTSCSKDNSDEVLPEYQAKVMIKDGETVDLAKISNTKNTQGSISRKGNVYELRNFRQFTVGEDGKATTTPATFYYFDFKENDATADNEFVASLSGTSSVAIKTNTAKGYTLSFIDKDFDQVSATDKFAAIENNTSAIHKMIMAPGVESKLTEGGWCNYNMIIHIASAVENRTLVISKEGKPFFKLRINSVYSDGKPATPEKANNMVFYSIDYQELK